MPSSIESPSAGFGVHTPSKHALGCVGAPGRPQMPPVPHCPGLGPEVVHGAPTVPVRHRRPPQMPAPGQSALEAQGSAFAVLHVSQRQRNPVYPKAVHAGLEAEIVLEMSPVEKLMLRARTLEPSEVVGGQS